MGLRFIAMAVALPDGSYMTEDAVRAIAKGKATGVTEESLREMADGRPAILDWYRSVAEEGHDPTISGWMRAAAAFG